MGIKRLKTYLGKMCRPHQESLPSHTHLYIDGYGFMNFVAHQIPFQSDLGGRYDLYDAFLDDYIHKLTERNITVTVYMDGYAQLPFKGAESKGRSLNKNRIWMQMYYSLMHADCRENLPRNTRFALLMKCQFMATLSRLGVQTVKCRGEADLDLARVVRAQNSLEGNKRSCFVYGDDTDFIAMENVPYIKFGDLVFPDEGEEVKARVWRRATTAAALTPPLSEEKFVELCLLLGNDFTSDYPTSMMFSSASNVRLRDGYYPAQAATFVADEPEGFKLCSLTERLETCLQFSRLFYGPGCDWEGEEEADVASGAEGEEIHPLMIPRDIYDLDFRGLSDVMKQAIKDLSLDSFDLQTAEGLGRCLLILLHDTPTPIHQRCPIGFPTNAHIEAFFEMQRLLLSPDVGAQMRLEDLLVSSLRPSDLQWSNVVAATMYQKTCEALVKRSGYVVSPKQVFNGAVFHALMQTSTPAPPRAVRNVESMFAPRLKIRLCGNGPIPGNAPIIDLTRLGKECLALLHGGAGNRAACDLPLLVTCRQVIDMLRACQTQDQSSMLMSKDFVESQADVACYLIQNFVQRGCRIVVYAFEYHAISTISDFFKKNINSGVDIVIVDSNFVAADGHAGRMAALFQNPPPDKCQIIIIKGNMRHIFNKVVCVIDLCHSPFPRAAGMYAPPVCSLGDSGCRLGTYKLQPGRDTPFVRFRLVPNALMAGSSKEAILNIGLNVVTDAAVRQVISIRIRAVQDAMLPAADLLPANYAFNPNGLVLARLVQPNGQQKVSLTFVHQFEVDSCLHVCGGTTGEGYDHKHGFRLKCGMLSTNMFHKGNNVHPYAMQYGNSPCRRPPVSIMNMGDRNRLHAEVSSRVGAYLLDSAALAATNTVLYSERLRDIQKLQEMPEPPPPLFRATASFPMLSHSSHHHLLSIAAIRTMFGLAARVCVAATPDASDGGVGGGYTEDGEWLAVGLSELNLLPSMDDIDVYTDAVDEEEGGEEEEEEGDLTVESSVPLFNHHPSGGGEEDVDEDEDERDETSFRQFEYDEERELQAMWALEGDLLQGRGGHNYCSRRRRAGKEAK